MRSRRWFNPWLGVWILSGVMYVKQMNTQPIAYKGDENWQSRASIKRPRVLLGNDDEGEGDPALELTLSLSASTNNPHSNNQSPLGDANSFITNELKFLASQGITAGEDATATNLNGSSSPHNASSSSSSSSPPSKYKQLRFQSDNIGINTSSQPNQERSLIRPAGCPHCFMYVLPSKSNPKCPRCKSSILVDLSPLTSH
ncbi:hypothetical protein L7F22_040175 [Adiantum nelumboides]|nr:hypothetical protein [Adiantum nelumboides]